MNALVKIVQDRIQDINFLNHQKKNNTWTQNLAKIKVKEQQRQEQENLQIDFLSQRNNQTVQAKLNFEHTSFLIMKILEPNFDYQLRKSGNMLEIVFMYLMFYQHCNNYQNMNQLKEIIQKNQYKYESFLILIMKNLLMLSRNKIIESFKQEQTFESKYINIESNGNTSNLKLDKNSIFSDDQFESRQLKSEKHGQQISEKTEEISKNENATKDNSQDLPLTKIYGLTNTNKAEQAKIQSFEPKFENSQANYTPQLFPNIKKKKNGDFTLTKYNLKQKQDDIKDSQDLSQMFVRKTSIHKEQEQQQKEVRFLKTQMSLKVYSITNMASSFYAEKLGASNNLVEQMQDKLKQCQSNKLLSPKHESLKVEANNQPPKQNQKIIQKNLRKLIQTDRMQINDDNQNVNIKKEKKNNSVQLIFKKQINTINLQKQDNKINQIKNDGQNHEYNNQQNEQQDNNQISIHAYINKFDYDKHYQVPEFLIEQMQEYEPYDCDEFNLVNQRKERKDYQSQIQQYKNIIQRNNFIKLSINTYFYSFNPKKFQIQKINQLANLQNNMNDEKYFIFRNTRYKTDIKDYDFSSTRKTSTDKGLWYEPKKGNPFISPRNTELKTIFRQNYQNFNKVQGGEEYSDEDDQQIAFKINPESYKQIKYQKISNQLDKQLRKTSYNNN